MNTSASIDLLWQKIKEGNIVALSKAITILENQKNQQDKDHLLKHIFSSSFKSKVIAITGSPGVGKSTFLDIFGLYLANNSNIKIAILAIDPSSTETKGSILGDKTRMADLSKMPNVFIRPTASGGIMGGVSAHTKETIWLCQAAQYDYIFIETVGVGQSETLVQNVSDCFIYFAQPNAGDELQGIKKGILENVDIVIVNKADQDNIKSAQHQAQALKQAFHLNILKIPNWTIPIILNSSLNQSSLELISNTINDFFGKNQNWIDEKRHINNQEWVVDNIKHHISHTALHLKALEPIINSNIKWNDIDALSEIKHKIDEMFKKINN